MSGTTLASSSSSGPGGLITHSEWEEAQAAAMDKLGVDVHEWNGVRERERAEYRGAGMGAASGSVRSGMTGGTGSRAGAANRHRRVRYADDRVFEDEDDDDDDDAAFDRERGMGKDPGRDAALGRVRSHGSGTLFDEGRSQGASSGGLYDDHRANRSQASGGSRRDRDQSNDRDRDRRIERAFGMARMDAHEEERGSLGGCVPSPRLHMTQAVPAASQAQPVFRGTNRYGARGPAVAPRGASSSVGSTTINVPPSGAAKQGVPARQLFDPHLHDPVRFSHSPSVSTGNSGTTGTTAHTSRTGGSSALGGHSSYPSAIGAGRHGSSLATSVSLEPSPMVSRDRERDKEREKEPRDRGGAGGGYRNDRPRGNEDEEGDRERERRRRKEGSERGSQQHGRHRREGDDGRSRGSRSSEGSESLKDRERGRGKGWVSRRYR